MAPQLIQESATMKSYNTSPYRGEYSLNPDLESRESELISDLRALVARRREVERATLANHKHRYGHYGFMCLDCGQKVQSS
jgi:hypothetical protein